jgi:lactate dehydrogenase-like 2-hydroxyacid dehydrogenase
VLITPHAAFYSVHTPDRYLVRQAENAISWLRSGRPRYAVNDPTA